MIYTLEGATHGSQCNVRDFSTESRISTFGLNESVWVTVIFIPPKHAISKNVFI